MAEVELPDFYDGVNGIGSGFEDESDVLEGDSSHSCRRFQGLLLRDELVETLEESGYPWPWEMQRRSLPPALLGTDVNLIGNTGCGKTVSAAILCLELLGTSSTAPARHGLEHPSAEEPHPWQGGPEVLWLCPTADMAQRTRMELERLCLPLGVIVGQVSGERPISSDRQLLASEPVQLLLGTPGRALALLRERALKPEGLQRVVLSSSEELLADPGLARDLRELLFEVQHTQPQLLTLSHRYCTRTETLWKELGREPYIVKVKELSVTSPSADPEVSSHTVSTGEPRAARSAPSQQGQMCSLVQAEEEEKYSGLNHLLDSVDFHQALVITSTAERASSLCSRLQAASLPVVVAHQALAAEELESRLQLFRSFCKRILVVDEATEVQSCLSNGRVSLLIYYDAPSNLDACAQRVEASLLSGSSSAAGGRLVILGSSTDKAAIRAFESRFGKPAEMPLSIEQRCS